MLLLDDVSENRSTPSIEPVTVYPADPEKAPFISLERHKLENTTVSN